MPVATDVAEEIADIEKCVHLVRSGSQVMMMCASLAETGMEIKREGLVTLYLFSTGGSYRLIVKSMIPVLYPVVQLDEMLVKSILKVLQELTNLSNCK